MYPVGAVIVPKRTVYVKERGGNRERRRRKRTAERSLSLRGMSPSNLEMREGTGRGTGTGTGIARGTGLESATGKANGLETATEIEIEIATANATGTETTTDGTVIKIGTMIDEIGIGIEIGTATATATAINPESGIAIESGIETETETETETMIDATVRRTETTIGGIVIETGGAAAPDDETIGETTDGKETAIPEVRGKTKRLCRLTGISLAGSGRVRWNAIITLSMRPPCNPQQIYSQCITVLPQSLRPHHPLPVRPPSPTRHAHYAS